ncbi:MAG TPA: histidine phosphatase family protein [Candidatus Paceibacterota bacterium]
MLPMDLVLVRHGQSEGNAAKRLAEKGDESAYTPEFLNRHTASFRLTKTGRSQAKRAGKWLRDEFFEDSFGFDRFLMSEYTRAEETAALLNLPDASWLPEFNLTERDWGDLDNCTQSERENRFKEALKMREIEPFFSRPPNGESMAQACLRIWRILHMLHEECSDKRVIIVCHGEIMWAFRMMLERTPKDRFKRLYLSKRPENKIHNCQIIHYTRRNPKTGELAKHANWVRMVRPTQRPVWVGNWKKIVRPRYSNEQLLKRVSKIPSFVK